MRNAGHVDDEVGSTIGRQAFRQFSQLFRGFADLQPSSDFHDDVAVDFTCVEN
jgi:hypothetical protein